jgi:hypothetical protein
MLGQLILGSLGLPNVIVDIKGSGVARLTQGESGDEVQYEFATVPEPSTVLLLVTGLVAVGGSLRFPQMHPDTDRDRS